jgi:class 3 adenylate cyclase
MQQIADWLESLGMSEYAQRFAENRIDLSVLPDLTDQDLKELGVLLGDRRKIQRAIAKLAATSETAAPTPKPSSTLTGAPVQPLAIAQRSRERHLVTVMLCDLVDFYAEEWRDLGAFLDAASAAVTEMGGTVAKKLASGLVALFGYPAVQENDSERAVRAALATQRALTELNRINADTSRPALAARITIDSGPVVIDAAGEIFGDPPNVVVQAQALAEPGAVVVTAQIQRQVAGLFTTEERGSHKFKDVPETVTLYRIIGATSGGQPKPSYDRLIARAVSGLHRSTAEARQAVYEQARKALVAHLRFNQPALSNVYIAKERLALEEAIRKVETETARKSRTELPTEPRPATPPANAPDGGGASRPSWWDRANPSPASIAWVGSPELHEPREQLLSGRYSLKKQMITGFRDFDDLSAETAKAAKGRTSEAYEEEAPQYPAEEPVASSHRLGPYLDLEDLNCADYESPQERNLEPAYQFEEEQPLAVPPVRHRRRSLAQADEYERTLRPRSYGGIVRLLLVLIILAGAVAAVSWKWSVITELYQFFSYTGTKLQSQATHKPSAQSKPSDRILQEQGTGQAPSNGR